MKKIDFLTALALAAALCGCSRDRDGEQALPTQKLTLTASINATTRAGIAEGEQGVLKTAWGETDFIRVYNPAARTSAVFEIDERSDDNLTATFTGEISTQGGQLYATLGCSDPGDVYDGGGQVIGYGPSTNDLGYFYSQQGSGDMGHLGNFAILYGAFTVQNPTISFRHTMAFFKFTLTLPDGEAIPEGGRADITLDVPTARYPRMNLVDGSYYPLIDAWSTGILTIYLSELSAEDEELVAYMAVFPSDAGGRDIALRVEVSDGLGGTAVYGKTLAAKTPRLIEGGHYYTVTEQLGFLPLEDISSSDITDLTPEAF